MNLPVCHCAEYYGSHHPDCPALRALEAERAHADALAERLTSYTVFPDPMSWHGETLLCDLCGGRGTRKGRKRGTGDSPMEHKPECLLAAHAALREGPGSASGAREGQSDASGPNKEGSDA